MAVPTALRLLGIVHASSRSGTKDPNGPVLTLGPDDWREFTGRVKAGGYDLA
jgi:hypothetical protein